MKIISVKQNGKEWREWRGRGLGASDAAAILGISPYTTPFELWLAMTGIREKEPFNEYAVAAMKRGTVLEPEARKLFEERMGRKFPAVSAEHDEYDFIRASFDGYCEETSELVEIKCPGKVDHAKALKGEVPKHYYPQVQQQLLVSGAKLCYYVSWDGLGKDLAIVEVRPDAEFQAKMLTALVDFWKRVTERILPEVSAKDISKLLKGVEKDLANLTAAVGVFKLLAGDEK
jgi:putative phage-type endonuclease